MNPNGDYWFGNYVFVVLQPSLVVTCDHRACFHVLLLFCSIRRCQLREEERTRALFQEKQAIKREALPVAPKASTTMKTVTSKPTIEVGAGNVRASFMSSWIFVGGALRGISGCTYDFSNS